MFNLSVVTPEATLYNGSIEALVAPTVNGEIGILTNHHPLIAKLDIGGLKITLSDGSESVMFVAGGFMEVSKNTVTVLAEVAEHLDAIELAQAVVAREKAEEMLHDAKDSVTAEKLKEELRMMLMRERLAQISKYKKN